MSNQGILNLTFACLITMGLVGCGGTSSTPQGATQPDPISQEIQKTVDSKGPQVIPPGHTMNSGGEIVPDVTRSESDPDQ